MTAPSVPALGRTQPLVVKKRIPAGLLLDGEGLGDVLLPAREAPETLTAGDSVEVFLYADGEGRPQGTLRRPLAQYGEVALLKVVSTSRVGAFLEWGLPKDLLLPFAEQRGRPEVDKYQLVMVTRDRDGRLMASAQLDRFLEDQCDAFSQGEAVPMMVAHNTDIGCKVVVANRYWGMIHASELRAPLRRGQRLTGYVQRLREDQRLSLSLNPPGAAKRDVLADKIMARLEEQCGFLPLTDKSSPEQIHDAFRCSKNAFKQAIGKLYKDRKITISGDGITLL